MEASIDSVSTYLEAVQEEPAEPVANKGLSVAEKACLKVLLDAPNGLPSRELQNATSLGPVELADALKTLASRGLVSIQGQGTDEMVTTA